MCPDQHAIQLPGGEIMQIDEPAGIRIMCISGCLWITQDGDRNDYIVAPGEQVVFSRNGSLVVSATRASIIQMARSRREFDTVRPFVTRSVPAG